MRTVARLAALTLASILTASAGAQTYTPVAVAGYNHDIFAEAFPNAVTTTDTVLDATNHIMYTQGFAAAAGMTAGVADNGIISDAGNVHRYQLAPYAGPNALTMMRNVSGALTLTTPASYAKLSLLAFATENAATITVTIRFTDNSTTAYLTNTALSDWFFATTNVVTSGFGRMNRVAAGPYGQDGTPSNPRFYYVDFNLNCADQEKTVAEVQVRNTTTAGSNAPFPNVVVLAVSGLARTQTVASTIVSASCTGNNGSVTLAISGSSGPWNVTWNTSPAQNGLAATGLAAGNYTATITNAFGCTTTQPVTVPNVASAVTVSASGTPTTVCAGQPVQLSVTATGGTLTTSTWTPGALTGSTVTVNPTSNTTYTVAGTDNTGCPYSKTVTVNVNPVPATPTALDATVCAGSTATLSVQAPVAGITYNWYTANAGGTGVGTGTSFTTPPVSTQTIYFVEALSAQGCVQSVRTSASAFVTPAPATPVVSGATLCGPGSTTLSVPSAAGTTFNWYTAATGGTSIATGTTYTTPTLSTNTTFYVEAVGSTGCVQASRAPVTVTISAPPPAPAGTATGFCPGSGATFSVTAPNLLYTYSWYAAATGGTALSTGPTYNSGALSGPTTYYLAAATAPGCNSARTAVTANPFTALPAPVASVTAVTANSLSFGWTAVPGATGYEVSINNGGAWTTPSSGPSGTTHTVSGLQPGQSVTLIVRALGTAACLLSAPSAPVTGAAPSGDIWVPSAFTPNNDGLNDVLKVYGSGISTIDFRVFDQWGAEIYHGNDAANGWDGTRRGKKQPSGVYIYVIKAIMNGGTELLRKGSVNLIR